MDLKVIARSDQQITVASNRQHQSSNHNFDKNEVVVKLEQILETLLRQKSEVDVQRQGQKLFYEAQINQRNQNITQLMQQNKMLREKLDELTYDYEKSQTSIKTLKNVIERLELERDGLKSVVNYLQVKNREISCQLFDIQKATSKMEDYEREKKRKNQLILKKQANWILNCFDQESIFEYNMSQDQQNSKKTLQKSESVPILENERQISVKKSKVEPMRSSRNDSLKQKAKSRVFNQKSIATEEITELPPKKSQDFIKKRGSLAKNGLMGWSRKKKTVHEKSQYVEEKQRREKKNTTKK